MKKVLMLGTTAAMSEQFNKNNISILEEMGYEVHIVGNFREGNPISEERLEEFKNWIVEHHGKWFHWPATRNISDLKSNASAYRMVLKLMRKYNYRFMHCYTPIGSAIGRLAAKQAGIKSIYTAHGFHFYTGAPLKNWLLYYPVEWIMSWITDVLITINKEDYKRAKEHLHAKETVYVPGVGINTEYYKNLLVDRSKKRESLGLKSDDIMLISVGELNENKNHRIVLEAMGKIKHEKHDLFSHLHYFIAGKGELKDTLEKLSRELGIKDHIHLLGFRDDVPELLKSADIFLLPSKREGLSVALMEAMACGLPCIVSDIRGNRDLIRNNKGGKRISVENIAALKCHIEKLIENKENRIKYSEYNYKIVDDLSTCKISAKLILIYQKWGWKYEKEKSFHDKI